MIKHYYTISSLTAMIKHCNLDGIDIDYEHVNSDPNTFAECVGQLITGLKKKRCHYLFVKFFKEQKKNYGGGQVLASFISGGDQGLGPEDGFFEACDELVGEGKLGGIFVWCAVESRGHGFKYEKKSQDLLVSA
ncbi:unnamed protein product [Camellia sinensis]